MSPTVTQSPQSMHEGGMPTSQTVPEATAVAEIIRSMKGSLDELSKTFDVLAGQTADGQRPRAERRAVPGIADFQEQMKASDQRQEEQIEEIQRLFDDVLKTDVVEHLQTAIAKELSQQIDKAVEEQVSLLLPQYIPQDLVNEIVCHRRQLEELERQLHNSESRHGNSMLSTERMSDPLHTILKPNGEVSDFFPKDLEGLFYMDAETAKVLMEEYDIAEEVSTSRERNVNSLMRFCGVTYQMTVRAGGQTPKLSVIT
ncbi:hypothetical protein BKA93DRAFT_825282 [Sparassis latifolia]